MIEDKVWSEDPAKYIIGADEVGRGSFAGPICAAAVKINYSHLTLLTNVKDSKKLSAKKKVGTVFYTFFGIAFNTFCLAVLDRSYHAFFDGMGPVTGPIPFSIRFYFESRFENILHQIF